MPLTWLRSSSATSEIRAFGTLRTRPSFAAHEPNALRGPPKASPEENQIKRLGKLRASQRAIAVGGGASGDVTTAWPQGGGAADGALGAAAVVAGGLPGSTTTRVPTLTRV
jgi:hypothetical protein